MVDSALLLNINSATLIQQRGFSNIGSEFLCLG